MTLPDRAERRALAARIRFSAVAPDAAPARIAVERYFAEIDRRFATGFAAAEQSAHDLESFSPPYGIFVIGTDDTEPIACGGVQTIDVDDHRRCAEIKRMWVADNWRGTGLGSRLLRDLESRAAALGHHRVRLDTNDTLTEAIGLYRRAGYHEIDRYNDNPYARLWFEKELAWISGS
ncbi:GNAT family N-acetyltransferase [Microlunatus soli]|uniref:Acetyltransferase (GNAT) family protein n=1 Tax=Microlunatus soli TaxID=630515 RepID=A0A1H1UU69_9ACTN|nr:GNAT family N-acetyltransferase [Microlunatus soli]SDS76138.1 Acetyltransferase (GNAT) family protein [Microlunatus soli]